MGAYLLAKRPSPTSETAPAIVAAVFFRPAAFSLSDPGVIWSSV